MSNRYFFRIALSMAALLGAYCWGSLARAANYPDRPIQLIVPFSAGGGGDNAARIMAPVLSRILGGNIVIKNEAGASGLIGEEEVARAPKDGYTLLYDASSFAINPLIYPVPFDPSKDFEPISETVSAPNVMVVSVNSPYHTVQQFVAAAQKTPGKLSFASYGVGSLAQLIGELFKKDAGIDILHVPYKGAAPAVVDVIGGRVDTYFSSVAASIGAIRGGRLRALAVTTATRMKELPDVPTMEEIGYKDFDVLQWNGLFAPAGTSPQVISKLQKAVHMTLQDPEVKAKLNKLGLTTIGSTSQQFRALIQHEIARWSAVIKANDIKAH